MAHKHGETKSLMLLANVEPVPQELKPLPATKLEVKEVPAGKPPPLKSFVPQPRNPSEKLIPIRLNLANEGYTLRDSLIWKYEKDPKDPNTNSPEFVAKQLCDESDLPPSFHLLIVKEINDQVNEYLQQEKTGQDLASLVDPALYGCSGELLIKIKLELRVNDIVLQDAFLWDLKQTGNHPEVFAQQYVEDQELPTEMVSVVAHSIHEQIRESLLKLERGSDAGLLKSVRTYWRESDKPSWTPAISWLSQGDREAYERTQKRPKHGVAAPKHGHGSVRAAMPMMQAQPGVGMGRGIAGR
eukprot:Tamp_20762.p1 GENE.Tamp_20762~~Tamp_20762.p1  ORF type:complete len:319 (+),score=66.73 Tamp_20762:62-958(+)